MYHSEAWQKTDGIVKMSNGGEFNNESGVRKTIKSTAPSKSREPLLSLDLKGQREGVSPII